MNGIEVRNVSKRFGRLEALKNVSVCFEEGKICGLLGRNGAGKSTLFNVITNRIFPDGGDVLIDGEPAAENDNALGRLFMMSEKNFYPENMKVSEVFRWTKEFYPGFDRQRAEELAERFGLNPKKKVKSLSTGYASIFKIVVTLSSGADYMLFDEPILGLDANHRDLFYKVLIETYSERLCTMILSTHLIEEVSGVIENVVIIREGELLCTAPRDELLQNAWIVSGNAGAVDSFSEGREVIGTETLGGLKTAYFAEDLRGETAPAGAELVKMDLQKLFICLTNEKRGWPA